MRVLAIDLGDARTGLALGDDITHIATPVGTLEIPIDRADGDTLLDAIAARVDAELGPHDTLVLGLPLNMDGTEGPRAKLVRTFAARLAARTNRPVHLADERRSTVAADERMARTGLTRGQKKARRDAIAAAELLTRYLEQTPHERAAVPPVPPPNTHPPANDSAAAPEQ